MAVKKKVEKNKQVVPQKRADEARAVAKFLRVGPRKMRLVIDVIRHKPTSIAFRKLFVMRQKSARMIEKVLDTAIANAKVLGLDETKLFVSKVWADGGPVMKRFMARSMGRADRIIKRTSHVTLIVREAAKAVNVVAADAQSAVQAEIGESSKPAKQKEKSKKKASASAKA